MRRRFGRTLACLLLFVPLQGLANWTGPTTFDLHARPEHATAFVSFTFANSNLSVSLRRDAFALGDVIFNEPINIPPSVPGCATLVSITGNIEVSGVGGLRSVCGSSSVPSHGFILRRSRSIDTRTTTSSGSATIRLTHRRGSVISTRTITVNVTFGATGFAILKGAPPTNPSPPGCVLELCPLSSPGDIAMFDFPLYHSVACAGSCTPVAGLRFESDGELRRISSHGSTNNQLVGNAWGRPLGLYGRASEFQIRFDSGSRDFTGSSSPRGVWLSLTIHRQWAVTTLNASSTVSGTVSIRHAATGKVVLQAPMQLTAESTAAGCGFLCF